MKRILLACLLLSGCATDVIYKTVPVDVPVSVPCRVQPVAVPVWGTQGVTDKNTLFEQFKALAITNEQRKMYETTLVAELNACQ